MPTEGGWGADCNSMLPSSTKSQFSEALGPKEKESTALPTASGEIKGCKEFCAGSWYHWPRRVSLGWGVEHLYHRIQ